MSPRIVRIASRAALVVGALAAASAAALVAIAVLAVGGRVDYPVALGFGPLSLQHEISTPVTYAAPICQTFDVRDAGAPSDCLRWFVHDESWDGGGRIREQDADVRPTVATLQGSVAFSTVDGGGTRFVVLTVARDAGGLLVVSAILLLLGRLLSRVAAGRTFDHRSVRSVRAIGVLLIAGSLADTVLAALSGLGTLGYSAESFGPEVAVLEPAGGGSIELGQVAVGLLVLLLAEVFRRGAALEDETRLTV